MALLVSCLLPISADAAHSSKHRSAGAAVPAFALGVDDSSFANATEAPEAIARSHEIHARYARVMVGWATIAPGGSTRPAGFNARNPSDPKYRWGRIDAEIQRLSAAGLTVYATVLGAPGWAQRGTPPPNSGAAPGAWNPNPSDFGDFARAVAERYSGVFVDPASGIRLPKVTTWQAWNEPNLPMFLAPSSPELYRSLLNAFYDGIKSAQPHASVVTAGLAPVKSSLPAAFPKIFAMKLLCLKPRRGWFVKNTRCAAKARFDIFSVHPYSLRAKPAQRAGITGNMFVADVVDIAQMLRAAGRARTVSPARKKPLWVTEFSWFTNPPNRSVGDRLAVSGQHTLAALFALWRAGVTQLTWFAVSDRSATVVPGGGFYDRAGHAKPARDALRFPFYAAQRGRSAYVWGRAPSLATARVVIERRTNRRWRRVLRLRPQHNGMFSVRFRLGDARRGQFRARQRGTRSLPMSSLGYGVAPF